MPDLKHLNDDFFSMFFIILRFLSRTFSQKMYGDSMESVPKSSNMLTISFIISKHIHNNGKIPSQEDSSSHGWIKKLV
ncbi:protein of unknown function [Candidatus Nitrosotalea okcheonensis]|uniref:Uncharacterized protein n=1 Tax=Candidatus Nitrosotalea okcheonensis TaxID=1903276 RepID=A0A2H1FER8_9ARCH|nr:protein of unknown function [Candidatus Nitrosotalea okcheonensis]